MKFVMIVNLFLQVGIFVQLLDGEDSDEKVVIVMGIFNILETMLNVMEGFKEVYVCCNLVYMVVQFLEFLIWEIGRLFFMFSIIIVLYCNLN